MRKLFLAAFCAAVTPFIAMAEPSYLIGQIQVDDWDAFMNDYGSAAAPSLMEFQGKVLVGGPGATVIEGDWTGNHTVVIEFADMETANAWYNSATYAEARPLRFANTSLNNIVFANGFSMPE